jgi:hypothetical protein
MQVLWSYETFPYLNDYKQYGSMEVTGLIDKIDVFRISTGGNYNVHGN